ncbi:MAG: MoaD/ThiS family protein [Gammaproteobacteria bacterium]|nr:MoaD/ThiS family protein [Gammaproteobacteria bacterium]
MTIKVKLFGSLREQNPKAARELDADNLANPQDVWAAATDQASMPEHIVCAINHEHRESDHPVTDGDEVAFFPPVTGG